MRLISSLVFAVLTTALCLPLPLRAQNPCGGWSEAVIGTPLSGSTNFTACNPGTITITSAGFPTSYAADKQYMVQRELCGNGEIVVNIQSISGGLAGLEIRADNSPGSICASLKTAGSNFLFRSFRTTTGASASPQPMFAFSHSRLKLVRNGNDVEAWYSSDGIGWVFAGVFTLALPHCVRVGVLVESDNNAPATGVFNNLSFSGFSVPNSPATTFSFAAESLSADAGEDVQVCVNIANPCACAPASVQVALQGQSAPHLSGFSTQTLQFQSGDTQKCFDLPTAAAPGEGLYTLALQNPTGGNAAAIGTPAALALTVTGDPETPTDCPWAGPDVEICRGESVVIGCPDEVQPPAGSFYCYKWAPEEGLDDPSLPQPTASPQQTTTYTLYVTDNQGNVVATDGVLVTVNAPSPVEFFPENPTICVPDVPGLQANTTSQEKSASCSLTADVMVLGNYALYNWSDGSSSQGIQVLQPGIYAITVTDNNDCATVASVEVGYCTAPMLEIEPMDAMLCDDELVLTANVGFMQYTWLGGSAGNTLVVTEPGIYEITVVDAQGCKAIQSIEVTVCKPKIDLVIYNGLYDWHTDTPWSGGQMISEQEEETVGAVTVVNWNDTDGDGIDDHLDDVVMATPIGRNEVDLMKLVIKKPVPDKGGEVALSYSGEIRFWESPLKQTPVTDLVFPTTELDKTLYVEVLQPSQRLRDIEITAHYLNSTEKVTATGVWAEIRRVFHKRGTPDPATGMVPDGFPDNPVPGPGRDIPLLNNDNLIELINLDTRSSTDNSRYGFGLMRTPTITPPSAVDNAIGGKILLEFMVLPNDVLKYREFGGGVFIDITRQKETIKHYMPSSYDQFYFESAQQFPFNQNPPKDIEEANDDDWDTDEDNFPDWGMIYSFDGPNQVAYESNLSETLAFHIKRLNFKEFVRIHLGGQGVQTYNSVIGSRCSHKIDWRSSSYRKRSALNNYSVDVESSSYSFPIFQGIGNGNIEIELIAPNRSFGFQLEYDGNKWLLNDFQFSYAQADGQGPWNLIFPNVISISITSGTIPFSAGDKYIFNIFVTENPNGKENFIQLGNFLTIDGPR